MSEMPEAEISIAGKQPFRLGEWLVIPKLHRMQRDAEVRQLEPRVMQVLLFLASKPLHVISHDELIDAVWGGVAVSGNVVTYSIAALRKALEDDWRAPRYIETISKSGYRLIAPLQAAEATGDSPVLAAAAGAGVAEDAEKTTPDAARHSLGGADATGVRPSPAGATGRNARPSARRTWLPAGASGRDARPSGRRTWLLAGVAGAVLALAIVGAARVWLPATDTRPAMLQPVPVTTLPGSEVQPALSPDGNHVAFAWMRPGRSDRDLYVTLVGSGAPAPLAASEDHERSPAWTPDGLHVAYARWGIDGRNCGIYKVPAVGGTSERIADCPGRPIGNMSFSPDGGLLAVGASGPAGEPAQIFVIDLDSGATSVVGDPPPDRQGDYYPMFAPAGDRISFLRIRGDGLSDVYTARPDGGDITRVTFDNRDIGGTAWSGDGATLYFSSYRSGQYTLWKVASAGGAPTRVALSDHNVVSPSFSPARDRLVYAKRVVDVNLWTARLGGGEARADEPASADPGRDDHDGVGGAASAPRRLLSSSMWEAHPAFSPDGLRVAFVSDRSGTFEVYSAGVDGTDLRRHTAFGGPFVAHPSWSPDGRTIVFDARPEGHADLWIVDAEGSAPRRLTRHPDDELSAAFSADGAAIYFTSHRSGAWQIWRVPAAGGVAEMVTTGGGYRAMEGPDGSFLYYSKYDAEGLWRLPVDGSSAEELVQPALGLVDAHNWLVGPGGIFSLHSASRQIYRYEPKTGSLLPLASVPADLLRQARSLSVSPDGRALIWAQIDRREDDIYLVDGIGRPLAGTGS